MESFANKLELVVKALSVSRGKLGQELGVDKSVVSRWLAGTRVPTSTNLAAITAFVRTSVDGFTMLDWDRDLVDLASRLGADNERGTVTVLGTLPALPFAAEARVSIEENATRFQGHWVGWRPTFRDQTQFTRDALMIEREGQDLAIHFGSGAVRSKGWFLPGDGKGYAVMPHRFSDVPAMMILYTPMGRRAQIMEGVLMTVTALSGRGLVSTPYVLERHADLLSDRDQNARAFEMLSQEGASDTDVSIPPVVQRRLTNEQINSFSLSGDGSLARDATYAECAAAAAAARTLVSRVARSAVE